MTHLINLCPCCSGKEYGLCCKPFHEGSALPENALQLMRSRYSAYALNLPDYIMKTTHPENPQYSNDTSSWKKRICHFSLRSIFQKLEILGFEEKGNWATVTFTAHLTQKGQDATFTETSEFEKVNGQWFYKKGLIIR